ncbi:MAG: response regulator [Desulfovibrionaceae bacterium]
MNKLDGFRELDFLEQITLLNELSGSASPDNLPALVALFENPIGDATIDSMVIHAINTVFDQHPETVLEGLASGRPDLRTLSIRAAGEARVAAAVPALLGMAREADNPDERIDLFTALAQIADPAALDLMRENISSQDDLLAAVCIEACGHMRDEACIPALLRVIRANEAEDRFEQCDITTWKAVSALAELATPEAVAALASVLHHKNPTARRIISDAVVSLGERAVPSLLEAFEQDDPDQRILVANLLGFIGERPGADGLVKAFDRGLAQDPNVRYALYEALGRIGSMKSVICLLDGLHETDELILMSVVTALERQITPPAAREDGVSGPVNTGLVRQVARAFKEGDAQSRRLALAVTSAKAARLFSELYRDKAIGNLLVTALTASHDMDVVETFAMALREMGHDQERVEADLKRLPSLARSQRRALIADDSKSMLALQRAILTELGYTPVLAKDGAEALAAAEEEPFELVITDMNMPNMDGMELIQELRAMDEYAGVPIIMVTTESEASQRDLAASSGVSAFITKPFKPEALKAMILEVAASSGN